MIKNEREFRITNAQADKFRAAIASAAREGPAKGVAPRLHEVSIAGLRSQLQDLEHELREYEMLQTHRGKLTLDGPADAIGALLIKARIARGWSQRELGDRLGLHMQKIQQYEATEYASASVTRIREVLQALGATAKIGLQLLAIPADLEAIRAGEKPAPAKRQVKRSRAS